MTELNRDVSLADARSLIDSYAFDLGRNDAKSLLKGWLDLYPAGWIKLATIEALYLGRYKAISIEQILSVWQRIGTPNPHFTYEFERLICRKLPDSSRNLSDFSSWEVETKASDRSQSPVEPLTEARSNPSTVETDFKPEKASENFDSQEQTISLSALGLSYKSNWSEFVEGSKTIHQFIPLPDVSSFFHKLKTFGEQKLESQ